MFVIANNTTVCFLGFMPFPICAPRTKVYLIQLSIHKSNKRFINPEKISVKKGIAQTD